jgi:hypothetical protein
MGSAVPDIVTSITSGIQSETTIAYKPLTDSLAYTKDTGLNAAPYPNVDLQMPMYVVSSVMQSNGIGGTVSSSYKYGGAKANYQGRGFLGFRWMEVTNDTTQIKTRTEFSQSYPYIGTPKQVKKIVPSGGGAGGVVNQVDNAFSYSDLAGANPTCAAAGQPDPLPASTSGKRFFVSVCRSVEQSWDLNGAVMPVVTTSNSFDNWGNATQVTVSTSDGYSKSTLNTYVDPPDTLNWILGRLKRAQVTSTTP